MKLRLSLAFLLGVLVASNAEGFFSILLILLFVTIFLIVVIALCLDDVWEEILRIAGNFFRRFLGMKKIDENGNEVEFD